jgi:F-type H+-transporting ATPase subunit b|tara:strand:+ start:761 stop:1258 length:498 start_codon:yes stop_codon:yes gene_type:complete
MIIDATFWVAISFLLFVLLLIYYKIPSKIKNILDENITLIKNQIDESEKLKEEAKNRLAENEKKLGDSKSEIQEMIIEANEQAEKNIIRTNEIFHKQSEIRKKNTEEKIKQMKKQAIKDIKNLSVMLAFDSINNLMINSLDKSKLDKLFNQSIEETKLALHKKSS